MPLTSSPESEPDTSDETRICSGCVGESYLKRLIQADGALSQCSYCEAESSTITIEKLADLVEQAFEKHYDHTASEPEGWDYELEREGEPAQWAIAGAADVSEKIADDIRSILEVRHFDYDLVTKGEECPFSEGSHYTEKDAGHGGFLEFWNEFENGLKTRSRFFSPSAKTILDQIFGGLSDLQTTRREPVVVTAGPESPISTLYRARVFAGEKDKLETALKAPWKHLGTPPAEAAGAGRMNARGIAVFYGASDPKTALSEVRPPVGSDVAIAKFNIMRPLRLLDLDALRSVAAGGSIFDPDTLMKRQRANFLVTLSHRMSRPVMPLEEASEYLPTQAVADYLANEAELAGIIFPSIQTGQQSSNVVLFHHAARVEEVELPEGTEVEVMTQLEASDGVHPHYMIWEKAPPPAAQSESQKSVSHGSLGLHHFFDQALDPREPTLRIDRDTIQMHRVRAVTFDAPAQPVIRHLVRQRRQPSRTSETTAIEIEESLENPFG